MTTRGKLKIIMGYAAGVGKTYKMLEEAQVLKADAVDVVVGYFEPHGRKDTIAKTVGLELIPRRKIEYRGTVFEEMDTEAILARHPQVCAVDEFPHTNVPGSDRAKRWEDVLVLLDAGIHVLTTMNIQHLESYFFREQILVALRELALRQAAHEVEQRLDNGHLGSEEEPGRQTDEHHKILILVTADPETAMLIRRSKRMGDFLDAECFAVAVQPTGDLSTLQQTDREAVERHLNFARNLHIETRILEGEDAAAALVEFARRNQVTQIFVGRSPEKSRWIPPFSKNIVHRIVGLAKDMQVVIVSNPE